MRPRFRIRRLLQFRLGTLLLLVTIFCVALAFRQRYIVPYQRQATAVEKLLKRGGRAQYRPASPAWLGAVVGKEIYQDLVLLHVENRGLTDDALVSLYDTPHLERLYLAGNPLTDEGLRPLAGLRRLQRLSLWQTNITGDGLRHLQPLAELAALDLHDTRIRDADLAHLLPLRGLRELKLPVGITDDGLRTVGELPELTWLGLSRTSTTPAGLAHLAGCKLCKIEPAGLQRPLRGKDLVHLQGLEWLTALPAHVVDCRVADLDALANLRRLTTLNLSGRALNDEAIAKLERLPHLQTVCLTGRFSIAGLRRLRQMNLRSAEVSTPLIHGGNLDAIRTLQGKGSLRIISPWLTPTEESAAARFCPPGVELKTRHAAWRRIDPWPSPSAVLALDVMECVEDWTPLEGYADVASLGLRVAPETDLSSLPLHRLTRLQALAIETPILRLTWEDLARLPPSLKTLTLRTAFVRSSPPAQELAALAQPRVSIHLNPFPATNSPELFPLGIQTNGWHENWYRVTPDHDLGPLASAALTALKIESSVLSPDQWSALWRVAGLRSLTVGHTPLRDRDLAGIENLRALSTLELTSVLLTDEGLWRIASLPKLERLVLEVDRSEGSGPDVTAAGLAQLGRCRTLKQLHVHVPIPIGAAFAEWHGLRELSRLSVRGTHFDTAALRHLARLPKLESLNLMGTNLDDAMLPVLAEFPRLQQVSVSGSRVTADAIKQFAQKHARPRLGH